MAEKNYITVTELNYYLNRIIASEELLQNIPVLGEVSGLSVSGNNLYFTIKDESAQLQACFFNFGKAYIPIDGEQVLLFGSPDFFARGGRLSFIVSKIEPFGKGKLYAELEKLKKKLQAEGLFDAIHKRPLPIYPTNIGVVSSMTGAVIHDIVKTVRKHNKASNITLVNVPVQGDAAADAICDGLRLADRQGFDVVVLARGGGSFEDLMPFNSEKVARAVFDMKTVIVSAVGHETDFSLTDFVADYRAMTPTAAAEALAFDAYCLTDTIINKLNKIASALSAKTDAMYTKVSSRTKAVTYICTARLQAYTDMIYKAVDTSLLYTRANIDSKERKVETLIAKLSALNPANLLSKGYFRIMKGTSNVDRLETLEVDDNIRIFGADGTLDAKVVSKNIDVGTNNMPNKVEEII